MIRTRKMILRTNLAICMILLIGFVSVSVVGYYSNTNVQRKDIEHVAALTSESIFYQIETFFSEPVNVSRTMANDMLLKDLLAEEEQHIDDAEYVEQMQSYLKAYKEQHEYDSVFLVSTQTNRYYHFNGLDRVLEQGDPENEWYYSFLDEGMEYSLNVDNDEAARDVITVFVNCKITDGEGATIGVVGVGMKVQNLQQLLHSYDEQYNIRAMLVDEEGILQLSSEETGEKRINLFDNPRYEGDAQKVLKGRGTDYFWQEDGKGECYIVASYVPTLGWHLLVENNTDAMYRQFERQFVIGVIITVFIISLILYIINRIVNKYNNGLIKLAVTQEMEYRGLLNEAAEGLYENVFELDITHDCAGGEKTRQYFESLGISGGTSYQKALRVIAKKQIKPEFVDAYLKTFSAKNVLAAYDRGISERYCDVMITDGDGKYRWMRIRARVFYWDSDQSVRMITYRKDITAEKEHEAAMLYLAQSDSLTGIYNKAATAERITQVIQEGNKEQVHALVMIDIDCFKNINDTYGHAVGDKVIQKFAERLKTQFRSTDICGRVGGDEFVVFLKNIPHLTWLLEQMKQLTSRLNEDILLEDGSCPVSASIGVAVFPQAGTDFETLYRNADEALYNSKRKGKNRFCLYEHLSE